LELPPRQNAGWFSLNRVLEALQHGGGK